MKTLAKAAFALIIMIISGSALFTARAGDASFKDETLHYVITYKWGLVHKDAGEATLSLRDRGDTYRMTLTGRTKPWADKFFMVRDTLIATVAKKGFNPVSYSKIAHEDGRYSREDLAYTTAGNHVGTKVKKVKVSKKGERTESSARLTATGRSFDMLSVFYFLRTLDFTTLEKGKPLTVNIFSGSKAEKLTIRYTGEETVKLRDGSRRKAYRLKFRFTQHGGKKSSEDIDAWISADAARIPLELTGSLPIGKVHCYLLP